MNKVTKKLAHALFGEYAVYFIYSHATGEKFVDQSGEATTLKISSVDKIAIESSSDSLIREQAEYTGPGSYAYACFEQDRIVGVCFYWFGDRYRKRNFWPLADGEAKLVQIITLPDMRGRGVATKLIEHSCGDMMRNGFTKAYARIWHSNTPSLRAFERAGWTRGFIVIEINPLRRARPIRICWPWKR